MQAAENAAIASGILSFSLMEQAGIACAEAAMRLFSRGGVLLLCGPGNNGGDGYVAAKRLRELGWPVRVMALIPEGGLKGDAARAAAEWGGPIEPFAPEAIGSPVFIMDAMFGVGLNRPLDGPAAAMIQTIGAAGIPVLAIDVPSGLPGDTGRPLGPVLAARSTVTFCRKKPAHLLEPGRSLCGQVIVADIGVPDSVLGGLDLKVFENEPELWAGKLIWPGAGSHKHGRGKLAVWASGPRRGPSLSCGAPRLSAAAGLRAGAGWVTLVSLPDDIPPLGVDAAAILHGAVGSIEDLTQAFGAHQAAIIGPGMGQFSEVRDVVTAALKGGQASVVDADAITAFRDDPKALFAALPERAVLTPHLGEFVRLFPGIWEAAPEKLTAALRAAESCGRIILLKGPDTVIAAPDGRARVNVHATPFLASAGTGDVLAGIIGAFLAQGMDAFDAASAGAWIHGEAGRRIGPGLIADDLPGVLPDILNAFAPDEIRRPD